MMKCYSPKPPGDYNTLGHGPGVALMSDATGRDMQGRFDLWNLVYLTFPEVDTYLTGLAALDYAPATRRAVEVLDDPSFGFVVEALRNGTLNGVATRLKNHPSFKHLELTKEYGEAWVDTALERAGELATEATTDGNVVHLNFRR